MPPRLQHMVVRQDVPVSIDQKAAAEDMHVDRPGSSFRGHEDLPFGIGEWIAIGVDAVEVELRTVFTVVKPHNGVDRHTLLE